MPSRVFVLPKQGQRPETSSFTLSQLAGAVKQAERETSRYPWSQGVLIAGLQITSTATVSHGLKRTPAGWFFTRIIGDANLIVPATSDVDSEKLVIQNTTGNPVTFDIWVW